MFYKGSVPPDSGGARIQEVWQGNGKLVYSYLFKVTVRISGRISGRLPTPDSLIILSASSPVDRQLSSQIVHKYLLLTNWQQPIDKSNKRLSGVEKTIRRYVHLPKQFWSLIDDRVH